MILLSLIRKSLTNLFPIVFFTIVLLPHITKVINHFKSSPYFFFHSIGACFLTFSISVFCFFIDLYLYRISNCVPIEMFRFFISSAFLPKKQYIFLWINRRTYTNHPYRFFNSFTHLYNPNDKLTNLFFYLLNH